MLSNLLRPGRIVPHRIIVNQQYRMTSNKSFMDKVLALRPDMAGADEKEKATISSLMSEASKLSSDIQVSQPLMKTLVQCCVVLNLALYTGSRRQAHLPYLPAFVTTHTS
jgi:hypothetical protein